MQNVTCFPRQTPGKQSILENDDSEFKGDKKKKKEKKTLKAFCKCDIVKLGHFHEEPENMNGIDTAACPAPFQSHSVLLLSACSGVCNS